MSSSIKKDPELIDSYSKNLTYISGNIKRTIKADHILGLAILLLSFINHICKIN